MKFQMARTTSQHRKQLEPKIDWQGYDPNLVHFPTWLVDQLIPERSTICIYGPPNAGKSFLVLDMALAIATGAPWMSLGTKITHGKQKKPGHVVYILAEGPKSLHRRITAWMDHHQISPDQRKDKLSKCFFIPIVENLLIDRPADLERLINGIRDRCPDVSLIIFDPLVSFMSGDENNAHDTQDLVHAMRKLAETFEANDCSVMVVHHSGKEASRQERGSSALRGGVETLLELNGHKMLRVIKQRDAAKHEDIQIRFRTAVQIGENGETQELGQVVVQPTEPSTPETTDPLTLPPSSLAPRIRRTRKNKETMIRVLADTAYKAPDTVFVVSEFFTSLRKLPRADFSCKKSSYYTILRELANGDNQAGPFIVRPNKSRVFTLVPDALKKIAPDLRAKPSDTEDQLPDEPVREADATENDE